MTSQITANYDSGLSQIMDPAANQIKNMIASMGQNVFAICGDSRAAVRNVIRTITAATALNGVITITQAAHTRILGERMNIMNLTTVAGVNHPELNGSYVISGLVDVDNYQIDTGNINLNGTVAGSVGGQFQIGSLRETSSDGWIAWLEVFCGNRIEIAENFAIGGCVLNTSPTALPSDGLSQVKAAVARGYRNIIMDCGINAITSGDDSVKLWADIKAIYDYCISANIVLWDATIVGLGTGYTPYANAATGYTNLGHKTNVIAASINEKKKRYALRYYNNIIILDLAKVTCDGASTTGAMQTTLLKDGIHFNASGARQGGNVGAVTINQRVGKYTRIPYSLVQSSSRQGALDRFASVNTLFNDGAVQGNGLAAVWAQSLNNTTSVNTLVARTLNADGDTSGNNQICTITASAAGSYTLKIGFSNYSITDLLQTISDIKLTGMSSVTGFTVFMNVTAKNNLGVDTIYVFTCMTIGTGFDNTDVNLQINTPTTAFPSSYSNGALSGSLNLQLNFGAAGGAVLNAGCTAAEKLQPL